MFMKAATRLLLSLVILVAGARASHAVIAMADYTDIPFFMSNTVTPNILIVQDNSGSMNEFAYGDDGSVDDYDPAKTYYGYFTPGYMYSYASNTWTIDSAGTWSGNFMNWATMRKVDVARKVLMGGLATSRTGGGNQKNIGESPASGAYGETQTHTLKTALAAGLTPFNPDATYYYVYTLNRSGLTVTKKLKTTGATSACGTCPSNWTVNIQKNSTLEPTDFISGNLSGIMQQVATKARWGLMYFDTSNDGGSLAESIPNTTGYGTNFITTYQNKAMSTATPLAETLYCALGYYKQDATIATYYKTSGSATNAAYTTGSGVDPFNYSGTNVGCGKNFIIYLTDGEPTSDTLIPASLNTHGGSDLGTSDAMDNIALWGHTVDLRSDITGTQVTNLYPVYTFGPPAVTYAETATAGGPAAGVYYYRVAVYDNTGATGNVLYRSEERRFVSQNGKKIKITFGTVSGMKSYKVFGRTSGTPSSCAAWTVNATTGPSGVTFDSNDAIAAAALPTPVNGLETPDIGRKLLRSAARYGAFIDSNGNSLPDLQSEWGSLGRTVDGATVPDTYYEASDGAALEAELMAAIEDILKRASSGTAISVLATSASGAGNIFQAYFLPSKTIVTTTTYDVTWLGHLLSLKIDANGSMLDKYDNCISFSFDATAAETMINTLSKNADGSCGTTVGTTTQLINWENYVWDGGKELLTKAASARTIFTFLDSDKDGVVDSGEKIDFSTANAATLQKHLRTSTVAEATNIINFTRGSYVSSSYRDRTISGTNQWKLGDIIHSTPTVVGAPMENYGLLYKDSGYAAYKTAQSVPTERTTMVYIGANDGMLHAFNASTGDEAWAFIPYNLIPHLKWLADVNYAHTNYVDLKVKVSDMNFGTTASPDWRTVIIGGMRFGGGEIDDAGYDADGDGDSPATKLRKWRSSYFALDITTPASPVVLWEFGHNLANYTGLTDNMMGFSQTYPCVVKVGDNYFAVFGSGAQAAYTPLYDGTSTTTSRLFVLNIKTGALAASFAVSDSSSWFSDPISVDVDFSTTNPVVGGSGTSYNTEVVYIGETYYASAAWKSRMWRLVMNNDVNPVNWKMYDMYNMANNQPISSSPSTSTDSGGNLWLFFGTGKFLNSTDKTDVNQQTFYGMKDPCWDATTIAWSTTCTWGSQNPAGGTPSVASTQLLNMSTAAVTTAGAVSGVSGATTWSALVTLMAGYKGWYINFSTSGERALNKPTIIGGLVLFTTFIPATDVCALGGNSYFWAAYYETGTAYTKSVIGLSGTTVLRRSTTASTGMASSIAVHSGRESGAKAYVQMSTGEATVIEFNPAISQKSGIIAWREL